MLNYRVLLLNADYTPYDIIAWQRTMSKLLSDNPSIIVVKETFDRIIRDGNGNKYLVPTVVALQKYRSDQNKPATYTKNNIYARDRNICQYCGTLTTHKNRTVDHVIPRSSIDWKRHKHSFKCSSFENVVTCCKACNIHKKDRTPQQAKLTLHKRPKIITRVQAYMSKLKLDYIHPDWDDFVNGD